MAELVLPIPVAVIERTLNTLTWMIADLDWRKEQTGIGHVESPEMKEAKAVQRELMQALLPVKDDDGVYHG
jgi:hypothetical protein